MVEPRSWIPMGDGVRLAASLYLPEAVEDGVAAPVVLEALPYRKDDVTASYRAEYERLCDEYGYAVARGGPAGDGVVGGGGDRRVPGE
jgi:predicted acyl esterase